MNKFDEERAVGSFEPFEDYLGLSNLVGTQTTNLSNLQNTDNPNLGLLNRVLQKLETLDIARKNNRDDFYRNGIDCELDEFDIYQASVRGRGSSTTMSPASTVSNSPTNNSPLMEYLSLQEKRRSMRAAKAVNNRNKVCVFCKNNGETLSVYSSHVLKDINGKVICPILRKYACPFCGTSGDNAHTIKYCPMNEGDINSVALLRTSRLSTGKKRRV